MSESEDKTMGIISIVLGVLGFTFLPFIGSVIAIILGHVAKGTDGDQLGKIGRILGWVGICIYILGGLIAIALVVIVPLLGFSLFPAYTVI